MSVLAGPDLTGFGREPLWVTVLKTVVIFVVLMVLVLLTIWGERRIVARMQQRLGPNRVGPFGMLQGLADGIKLMLKEDIIPALADKPIYVLAPIASAIPAFLAFSVVPFGPSVSIAGHRTALQLTDLPVGVLFILACSALGVYGIILSGWSSGSTFPLLGALRSAAQVISYEVAMGLALVPVFLYSGTLSTSGIVASQHDLWYVFALPVSFGIYCVAMVGETNRAPFDLAEAETELVGGFHTEYSSIKFAMFFLAEYINMVTVSALATTLFLGGWRAPFPLSLWHGANQGWFPLIWFSGKVLVFLFVFIWLRGTLPRLRYDQFMSLGWKRLIPIGLVWTMIVAGVRTIQDHVSNTIPWVIAGVVLLVLALGLWVLDPGGAKRRQEQERLEHQRVADAPTLDAIPWPPRPAGNPRVLAGAAAGRGAVRRTPGAADEPRGTTGAVRAEPGREGPL